MKSALRHITGHIILFKALCLSTFKTRSVFLKSHLAFQESHSRLYHKSASVNISERCCFMIEITLPLQPLQEEEVQKQHKQLDEERKELQSKKEEYQRDLERLRDAQRKLEKEREAVQRQIHRMEELRPSEVSRGDGCQGNMTT